MQKHHDTAVPGPTAQRNINLFISFRAAELIRAVGYLIGSGFIALIWMLAVNITVTLAVKGIDAIWIVTGIALVLTILPLVYTFYIGRKTIKFKEEILSRQEQNISHYQSMDKSAEKNNDHSSEK